LFVEFLNTPVVDLNIGMRDLDGTGMPVAVLSDGIIDRTGCAAVTVFVEVVIAGLGLICSCLARFAVFCVVGVDDILFRSLSMLLVNILTLVL